MEYICYMITHAYQNTYVGITNDFTRRLNQHNGILKGGAKATHKYQDWTLAFYISGFKTKSEVLSFEWHMHHPNGKRRKDSTSKDYYGVCGRVRALCQILTYREKISSSSSSYICHMTPKCVEYIQKNDMDLYIYLESLMEIQYIEES